MEREQNKAPHQSKNSEDSRAKGLDKQQEKKAVKVQRELDKGSRARESTAGRKA